jgi:cell wall-associated NlpC family hydrolase
MRRNWLAGAAVAAVAISVPVTALTVPVLGGTAQAATVSSQQKATVATTVKPRQIKKAVVTPLWNKVAAALAKKLVGAPYELGGTSPAGFDCSGLTQWVYRHASHGKKIDRTSEDQYHQFKRISKKDARTGDLVFFHETSSPSSYVYHVGVYEGGNDMVAAATPGEGVRLQSFAWAGDTVTFGTITHS